MSTTHELKIRGFPWWINYEISYDANEPIYKLKPIRLCGDDVILGEEALIELYDKVN